MWNERSWSIRAFNTGGAVELGLVRDPDAVDRDQAREVARAQAAAGLGDQAVFDSADLVGIDSEDDSRRETVVLVEDEARDLLPGKAGRCR